jgi:REP element-mobilizing transposase RayT
LKGYDYSRAGAYFVTICAHKRACLFGEIVDGEMVLNDAGSVAAKCWHTIPDHFPHVILDTFVVMPNHVHGILFIVNASVGAKNFSPLPSKPRGTSKTIGSVIRGFKIGVTKWMRQNTEFHNIWQRNYYEHIVRNENELNRIREYITDNPMKWEFDQENPAVGTGRF